MLVRLDCDGFVREVMKLEPVVMVVRSFRVISSIGLRSGGWEGFEIGEGGDGGRLSSEWSGWTYSLW